MKIFAKRLLTPGGWRENRLVIIENGVIQAIESGTQGDINCPLLVPGFVDVHCHGGEGFYTLTPTWPLLKKYLMRAAHSGVTDVFPGISTYTDVSGYYKALDFLREAMRLQKKGELHGARIAGVHLEGPFISPLRSGAMDPEKMLVPSPETYDRIFGQYDDIISMVTLAPEREGARELTAHLLKKGVCVQAGHTDAACAQADEAFGWGVNSLCHTFNAARGIHHREPGVVAAALLDENVYCEAICDLRHLHPSAIKLIYRMKGPRRMEIISDSVAVTGLPDGEYDINGKHYLIVDGTQRVKGGNTLSGGACYLDQSVRNLISIGIPEEDALFMASATPAQRMGRTDLGSVRPGCRAHLTALSDTHQVLFSMADEFIYTAH